MNKSEQHKATRLHQRAMAHAERALRAGDVESRDRFNRLAFMSESEAASILEDEKDLEPTRSILYLSAAVLARRCRDFGSADKMIFTALTGNPPSKIAAELHELYEIVRFERYLEAHDVVLEEQDFSLLVRGRGVAPGLVADHAFLARFMVAGKIFTRVAEHVISDGKKLAKSIRESFRLYLATTQPAGSFSVTIRVGHERQLVLPGAVDQIGLIIDEMIDAAELFNAGDQEALERAIPDEDYRRGLRQLFDQFAPDGEEVNLVGLSRRRQGELKEAKLTRTAAAPPLEELIEREQQAIEERRRTIFRGRLLFANELKKTHKIIIRDNDGKEWPLYVNRGEMDDIVGPLWGKDVVARGKRKRKDSKFPHLVEIYESREKSRNDEGNTSGLLR